MGNKIFVDSDVVIDLLTDRDPFANPASELFDLNENRVGETVITKKKTAPLH